MPAMRVVRVTNLYINSRISRSRKEEEGIFRNKNSNKQIERSKPPENQKTGVEKYQLEKMILNLYNQSTYIHLLKEKLFNLKLYEIT